MTSVPADGPETPSRGRGPTPPVDAGGELPMLAATSQFAEMSRGVGRPRAEVPPRRLKRGLVVFDLDGTILDDLGLISTVAGDVLEKSFGTPAEEGRVHYLATTGMPFEAQLAQLYPGASAELRASTARTFHQRKVAEAYAKAKPFPEIPKLLNRLDREGWTMAISTGAETEMAELILEREGLRYWFEDVLGSADGTKREHLAEYARRYPGASLFLVGDSRFDMEAALSVPGVRALGRVSTVRGWTLTASDLAQWGAVWADSNLSALPEVLDRLSKSPARSPARAKARRRRP